MAKIITTNESEHDFTLVLTGINELTREVVDGMYEACDDATLGMSCGRAFLDFSRKAPSMKDAILSAIRDVRAAGVGADVLRVEWSSLVTQAEIARKIGRSRQMVHQYIRGHRGQGGFPLPACELAEGQPLWNWCEVALWLWENNLVRESVFREAEAVETINVVLDYAYKMKHQARLTREVKSAVAQRIA